MFIKLRHRLGHVVRVNLALVSQYFEDTELDPDRNDRRVIGSILVIRGYPLEVKETVAELDQALSELYITVKDVGHGTDTPNSK